MTASKDDIPPIPVPPAGTSVPPVEPAPVAPSAPEPPAAPDPYAAPPAPLSQPAAPHPGYGPPAAAAAPYGQPTAAAPYGQPTAAYGQPGYAPQVAGPAQGLSITSMILGIAGVVLSFVGFGFLVALAAVITGHLGQKRQPWAKPFWLTGIITGYVGVGIGLITGLVLIFVFIAAIGTASYFG